MRRRYLKRAGNAQNAVPASLSICGALLFLEFRRQFSSFSTLGGGFSLQVFCRCTLGRDT